MRGIPESKQRASALAGGLGAAAGGAIESATQGFSKALGMAGGFISQHAPAFVKDLVPFLTDLSGVVV